MIRPQRRLGCASDAEPRARDEPAATARDPLLGVRSAGAGAPLLRCEPLGRWTVGGLLVRGAGVGVARCGAGCAGACGTGCGGIDWFDGRCIVCGPLIRAGAAAAGGAYACGCACG